MAKSSVALDDKYTQESGDVYISSIQTLVRLPLMQKQRDRAAGLNTAGFIAGYRGSPIGTYDFALWAARKHLDKNDIKFVPAVNEELAAAAIKGTQWLDRYPKAKYDGVFSLWYGKHLGVERAAEALKIGNYDGSGKHGGVLVVGADDIGGKSSITAAESDHIWIAGMLPILAPADTQEYLDYGLYGWALSRFSGLWVAYKAVTDTLELTRTIDVDPQRIQIVVPTDVEMPPGGLNTRQGDFYPLPMERRLVDYKLPAAKAFVRANGIDRVILDSPRRGLGIVTTGKAYLDVREALRELGVDEARARDLGIRLYKIGVVWPLEPENALAFGRGHQELLCVEEKRPVIEEQLTNLFYHEPASARPRITGKADEQGRPLKPAHGELSVHQAIDILAKRIEALGLGDDRLKERIAALRRQRGRLLELPKTPPSNLIRTAYFCSGCPHNTSTHTVEGSMAFTGVGCYGLVPMLMPERKTEWAAQMGAEGSLWVGLQNFIDVPHAFQNLGDGTYFHSGILAVRQAVAVEANVTYKLLYNDAVAMTGGQPIDGKLSVEDVANQMYWEGVRPVVVVTDEPEKYPATIRWPEGTTIRHRKELELVQKEMQQVKGVSLIIYDQTCAAEKRRRRKRGTFPNPQKRVFINQDVCEGCGDCNKKSNCVSVQPLETEFGRKRKIDQSNCNKDYSCLDGFCPSFVTVHGGAPRKAEAANTADQLESLFAGLPAPQQAGIDGSYNVLITGIGGTGVLTVGALLGMAAHLDHKACSVMDITGMAQKGGSVVTHLRFGEKKGDLYATRLWEESADLLIGCDLVVATGQAILDLLRHERARIVVNSDVVPTAQFQSNNAIDLNKDTLIAILNARVTKEHVTAVDATTSAVKLMGDSIATNVFMMGFALQKGLLPVSLESLEQAIRLNGVAIEDNLHALNWGRLAAQDAARLAQMLKAASGDEAPLDKPIPETVDRLIERRIGHLTAYQNADYAKSYSDFVAKVRAAENANVPGKTDLTRTVAWSLAKLMAYKDEYEVARFYTNGDFQRRIEAQFEGDYKLNFHLSPPILNPKDKATGKPRKMQFGPWMFQGFKLLAQLKGLRGTPFDVFGYNPERKRERALIAEYRNTVESVLPALTPENHEQVMKIAGLADNIRGYGHVKENNLKQYEQDLAQLLTSLNAVKSTPAKAA
ncbi:MAG TPA: indolepyruvate ferredoxin oxidoreductase family protein [Steroidobacteraceae bacterium]|nr:indolepyruvate ferredoxin oxidoreductase family protein [Steroidobacteraceae bacterium]